MKIPDVTLSKGFMKFSFTDVIREEFFGGWGIVTLVN